MNLRINISESVSPTLRRLVNSLRGGQRTEMQAAAGVEVQRVTADHIAALQRKPGSFAAKFGAPTSGWYQQAAEKVAAASALTANADEAVLTINHPGFTRAFRSVEIRPRTARALALPIHPAAFGHRAAELWDRLGLFIPKGKRVICATIGGVVTPLYLLVGSVTQKQDRSLLPSDDQFQAAAAVGVKGWLKMTLMQGGKL